jgi:hypothetical protein
VSGLRGIALFLLLATSIGHAADAEDTRIVFPAQTSQGSLVIGKVPPASQVSYAGRDLRVTPYGTVVFGVARDEQGPLEIAVRMANSRSETVRIEVVARQWPVEKCRRRATEDGGSTTGDCCTHRPRTSGGGCGTPAR